MFLNLGHTKLDVYHHSLVFVAEAYRFSRTLPQEERFNLVTQIRRAATSVHLNISEGSSRRSVAERKRYYEIARGSLIEVDAALDVCAALGYCHKDSLSIMGEAVLKCYQCISGLINACINAPQPLS